MLGRDPPAARPRAGSRATGELRRAAGDGRLPRHPGAPAVASASGCAARSPPRCCTRRGCWSWTSRPSGWTCSARSGCACSCVAERAEHGTTLLLTTHDMGDIERLCDRILVVDHGRLVYDGSLPGLAARVGAQRVLVVDLPDPVAGLTDVPGTTRARVGGATACASGWRSTPEDDDGRRGAGRGLAGTGRGARPGDRGAAHRGRRPADLPEPPRRARLIATDGDGFDGGPAEPRVALRCAGGTRSAVRGCASTTPCRREVDSHALTIPECAADRGADWSR